MDIPEPVPSQTDHSRTPPEAAPIQAKGIAPQAEDTSLQAEGTAPQPEAAPIPSTTATTTRNDRAKLFFGIGVALIVTALIGLAALIIPRLTANAPAQAHVTAAAMPASTEMFFSINPHFAQLPNGDVVDKAWGESAVKSVEDGLRQVLHDSKLDWDQDIAPWLGDDVALGMSNINWQTGAAPAGGEPTMILAIATRDKTKSDALLAKWRADREANGLTYREQVHRGVTLVEDTSTLPGEIKAYASLNDVIIFATNTNDVRAAIDARLDNKSLAQSRSYQSTLASLRGDRAATLYFDMPAILQFAGSAASLPGFTEAERTGMEAMQGFVLGLSFEPNGLRLETNFVFDADKLPVEQLGSLNAKGNPNQLLRQAPANTFLYVSLHNLAATATTVLKGAAISDPALNDTLKQFERQTGLNLQRDLFDWMTGELAIIGTPGKISSANQVPFGFTLIIEAANPHTAENNVHRFFQAVTKQSGAAIGDITIGDARLHAVQNESEQPTLIYGLLDNHIVIATSVDAIEKISAADAESLADDATFKAATAPLPTGNGGYFYFEPKPILDLVSIGLTLTGQNCNACTLFEPIKAIASASEQPPSQANIMRSIVFMLLDVK